jgi:hypothetical protein
VLLHRKAVLSRARVRFDQRCGTVGGRTANQGDLGRGTMQRVYGGIVRFDPQQPLPLSPFLSEHPLEYAGALIRSDAARGQISRHRYVNGRS